MNSNLEGWLTIAERRPDEKHYFDSLVLVIVRRLRSGWTPADAGEIVILRRAR